MSFVSILSIQDKRNGIMHLVVKKNNKDWCNNVEEPLPQSVIHIPLFLYDLQAQLLLKNLLTWQEEYLTRQPKARG